jgi:hypothetical protein
MLVGCEVATWEVVRKTLTGKLVPVKEAMAKMVWLLPTMLPVERTLAGFLSMRKRPSPCDPCDAVALTASWVAPVVQPPAQVPWKTLKSSRTCRS